MLRTILANLRHHTLESHPTHNECAAFMPKLQGITRTLIQKVLLSSEGGDGWNTGKVYDVLELLSLLFDVSNRCPHWRLALSGGEVEVVRSAQEDRWIQQFSVL